MARKFNTRRENRLEELGRVDAEKAHTSKGKRNLREEKSRIRSELATGGRATAKKKPRKGAGPSAPSPRKKYLKAINKTHGGGPDSGNIGKLKDMLHKAADANKGLGRKARPSPADLKRIKDKMPKKYPPKREMQPLRRGGKAKGPNRPRPQGPHMWVRGDKRKKYASGGAVMAGKKVGCQIK